MNDIAKQNINARLVKALRDENLTQLQAANYCGIRHEYISSACNPKTWFKCSNPGWEVLQKWANSGEKIKDYEPKQTFLSKKVSLDDFPPPIGKSGSRGKYRRKISGIVLKQNQLT